jgi:DNA-directed RNA polymerase subunit RPC12/RpoP
MSKPESYNATERRALEDALDRDDRPIACPACGHVVSIKPVTPPTDLAYVRRRVWLICGNCRRSTVIDLRRR